MHADTGDIDEDTFITFKTTETKCDEMYHHGIQLKANGYLQEALSCFLECAKQMQDTQYSKRFPQTLREIAALYRNLEFQEKATEFAKAELLFYEALIAGSQYEEARCPPDAPEDKETLIRKAEEYEKMAQFSRSRSKRKSALDYCGRAAKLRQVVLGTENELTLRTMEYFAVLYSESEGSESVERTGEENKNPLEPETLTAYSERLGDDGNTGSSECTKELTTTELPSENPNGALNIYYRPFNLAPVWLIFIAVALQLLVVLYVL